MQANSEWKELLPLVLVSERIFFLYLARNRPSGFVGVFCLMSHDVSVVVF